TDMDVSQCRQSQKLTQSAEVFRGDGLQHFFIADKACSFAIGTGDIEPIVETRRAGNFRNFAAYLAEGSGDLAFCVRRIVRPTGWLQFAEFPRLFAQSGDLFGRDLANDVRGKHANQPVVTVRYNQSSR